jgi:hypothetical protein
MMGSLGSFDEPRHSTATVNIFTRSGRSNELANACSAQIAGFARQAPFDGTPRVTLQRDKEKGVAVQLPPHRFLVCHPNDRWFSHGRGAVLLHAA